jgi:ElaB/YqjD/DUF883 family membrane-anchored ribosome-binding protein
MNGESTSADQAGQNAGDGDVLRQAAAGAGEDGTSVGRRTGRRVEQARRAAARGLDSAADAVHERTDRAANVAHRAADSLSKGADYLRTNEVRQMADDIIAGIRNHPVPALIGAVALGFLLGRVMSRD